MDIVLDTLIADWEALLRFAPRFLYGLAVLAVFVATGRFAGRGLGKLQRSSYFDHAGIRFLQQAVQWTIGGVGLLMALGVMGFQGIAASMLATGGVVAIILGFAFREIGENFLAGFFLAFSRPFEVGNLIRSGELTGTVRSIQLRNVHIRTADACDVFVPSSRIFREPLSNYTRDGLRRGEFRIGIAYHDAPEDVIALLEATAAGVDDVLPDPAPIVTISEFGTQHIEYAVYFWLDLMRSARGFLGTGTAVRIACWRALRDAGVTFSTDVTAGIDIKSMPAAVERPTR